MKQIIEILRENNLYEDNKNEIIVNKKEDFLRNYKINKGSRNKFPSHTKRNQAGFLLLDDEPFIISNKSVNNSWDSFWILLSNGSRILLKDCSFKEMEAELLFKELCKELDVSCANYDIVLLNGKIYLARPSFLSLNEYLYNYYGLTDKKDVDLRKLIHDSKAINQELFIRKMIMVDILAKNKNRIPNNLRVIKSPNTMKICPLFNNGIKDKNPSSRITIHDSSKDSEIIEYLVQDEIFRQWCFKKLISRSKPIPNFKDIISNEKGIYVDKHESFRSSIEDGRVLLLNSYKNS